MRRAGSLPPDRSARAQAERGELPAEGVTTGMKQVLEAVLRAEQQGELAALVTVVATEGSTPRKAGAKMLVYADGHGVGSIGGGCVEAEMTSRARQAIATRTPQLVGYDLTPEQAGEDGLVCGGRMQVFIEPIEGAPTLCLFGAGHVSQALARTAKPAGFRVEVADDRARFANAERFPDADLIVVDDLSSAARRMTLGRNSFAIVVTRGHGGDVEALASVLGKGLRFVGLLGSKAKLVHVVAALEARGVPREELAAIHCPLGVRIGAVTPEEIAVSILAELVAVRHGVEPADVRPMKAELPGRLKAVR